MCYVSHLQYKLIAILRRQYRIIAANIMRYWRLKIAILHHDPTITTINKTKQISSWQIEISILSSCETYPWQQCLVYTISRRSFEIPRNIVALNAENELIETEKSPQRDEHGELPQRDEHGELPNFQRPVK